MNPSSSFYVSKHNIEFVLEQYSLGRKPKELIMPYDREGGVVHVLAPERRVVQDAVVQYDLRTWLGDDAVRFENFGWMGSCQKVSVLRHSVGSGDYVYTTMGKKGDLRRVNWVAPALEQIARSFGHPAKYTGITPLGMKAFGSGDVDSF